VSFAWHAITDGARTTAAAGRASGVATLAVASGPALGTSWPAYVSVVRDGALVLVLEAGGRSGNTLTGLTPAPGWADAAVAEGDTLWIAPVEAYFREVRTAIDTNAAAVAANASAVAAMYTSAQVDTLLASKATTAALSSGLAGKADASTLAAHTGNTGNPHSVSAAQVGAYTTAEADTLLAGKASASHIHTFASLTGKPTTLSGYGIVDAAALSHTHTTADVTGLIAALALLAPLASPVLTGAVRSTGSIRTQDGSSNPLSGFDGKAAYLASETATLSATRTLALTSATVQYLDPNGANRDVTLPSVASGDAGWLVTVSNTATSGSYALVVKTSGGTQLGQSVPWGMNLTVQWDGASWRVL
jgi:hypothetical protein